MPQTAIAADLHEAANVERHLLTEIAFHGAVGFKQLAQRGDLVVVHVAHLLFEGDAGAVQQRTRARPANAVDIRQRDFRALVVG